MICPSGNEAEIQLTRDKVHRNWGEQIEFRAEKSFRPANRGELVEIVKNAEEGEERVKAVGSLWSFTGATVSRQVLIETDDLSGEIDSILPVLPLSESARARLGAGMIRHVRGGTKLCQLNRLLHGLGPGRCGGPDENPATLEAGPRSRALATMGGSGGQSIAGVLSTGVHGGDVHRRPVADMVLAVHLVGPGGQEWWIERPNTLTTGSAEELEASIADAIESEPDLEEELCRGVKVRKSEEFFRAVMVGVGRMGVIYSVVVAVERAFKLTEFRETQTWQRFQTRVAPESFLDFIRDRQLHYLSIIINPFRTEGGNACRVIQRRLAPLSTPNNWTEAPPVDFQGLLCSQRSVGDIVGRFLIPLSLQLDASIIAAFSIPILGPIVGPIIAAGAIAAKAVLDVLIAGLLAASTMTLSEFIALVGVALYEIGAEDLFAEIMSALFDAALPTISEASPLVAISWKMMDTYNYDRPDNCQKVDAMEVAFDALDTEGNTYLDFVDEVLAIFKEMQDRGVPVATLLAIRYSHGTDAYLGLSQFTKTCYVEIPLLQNFPGNEEFLRRAHAAALRHNGRPHWGQLIRVVNGRDVERMYGENHRRWRAVLTELIDEGGGRRDTFSNRFTRRYHLEPEAPEELGDCLVSAIGAIGDE